MSTQKRCSLQFIKSTHLESSLPTHMDKGFDTMLFHCQRMSKTPFVNNTHNSRWGKLSFEN